MQHSPKTPYFVYLRVPEPNMNLHSRFDSAIHYDVQRGGVKACCSGLRAGTTPRLGSGEVVRVVMSFWDGQKIIATFAKAIIFAFACQMKKSKQNTLLWVAAPPGGKPSGKTYLF